MVRPPHPRRRRAGLAGALAATALALAPVASADYTPRTQRIADDYRRDSTLSPCRHSASDLRAARAEAASDPAQGAPGLLGAIDAAIAARVSSTCPSEPPAPDPAGADGATAPGAASEATPEPAPGAGATPAAGAGADAQTPGAVPTVPSGEAPAAPAPAPTPAPAATPPPPAPSPAAALPRTTATSDGVGASFWVLAGAALLLALLALASLLVSRGRRGSEPLARTGHMWREAGWRLGAAWVDFAEWLKLGR